MKRRLVSAVWAACLLLACGSVSALDSELDTAAAAAVASPATDIPLQLANSIVCMGYNFRLDITLSPETRKLLDVSHLIMVPSDVVGTRGSKGGRDFFTMDVPSKEQTTFETLIPDTMVKGSLYYETVDLEPNTIYSALLCQKIAKHGEFYRTLKCGYRVDIVTQPGSKRSCLALNAWSLDFIPIQIVDKFPKLGVKGLITSFADVSTVNLMMSVESETRATDEAAAQTYVRFQTGEGGLRLSLHLTSTEPKWNNPGWCNISVSVHAGAKLADMRFLKRKDGYNIQVTSTVSPAANDVSFELDVDDSCSIPALRALKQAILRQKEGGHSSQFTSLASLQSALQKDAESATDSFQHIAASTLISGVKDNLFLSLQQLFRSMAGYIAQNPCFQRHYFANVQDRLNKVKFGLGLRYHVRQDSTMQITVMSPLLKEIFGDSEAANKFGTVITVEPEPDHYKTGYDPLVRIASQISTDIFEPLMMRFSSPYNTERLARLVDRIKSFLTPAVFALDTPEFILAAFHCGPEHPFWTCNPINKNLKPRASSSTGYYLKYDPTEYEASTFHYAPIMRLTDAQTACVDILGAHALVDVDKSDEEQSALIRRTLDLALAATKKAEKVVKESKRKRVANALAAMQAKGGGAGSDDAASEQSVDVDVDEDEGKDSFIEMDAEGIVGSASGSTLSESSSSSSSGGSGGLHNWTIEWLALRGILTPLNGTKLPIHALVSGPTDAATFDLRVEFSRIETELDSAAREIRFLTGEKPTPVASGTEGLVLRMTVATFAHAVSESAIGFVADNPNDATQLEVLVTVPSNQEMVRAVISVDSKNRIHLETGTGSLGSHMRIAVDWKNPRNAQWLRKHYPKANEAKSGQKAVVDVLNTRFLPRLLKRVEETVAKMTQFFTQHPCMQKYFVDGEDLQAGSAVFRIRLEDNIVSVDLDFKDVFAKILNKKVPSAMRRQGLQFTTQYLGAGTVFLEVATGAKHAALSDWSKLTVSLGEILSYGLATQAASRTTSAIQTAFELYGNFTSYANQFWTMQWPENPWQAVAINHTFPCLSKLCDRSGWDNLVSALNHWGSGTPGGKDLNSLERQYAQNQLDLANIRSEQMLRVEGIQRAHGAVLLSASDLTLQLRGLAEAVEKVKLIARGKYNPEDDHTTARPKAKALNPIKVVERYQRKVRAKADLKKIMVQHEKLIITANTKFAETDKVLMALLNREFIARGKVIGAAMAIEAKYNSLWPYVPALLPKMWTDSHLAKTVIAHPPPRTPFNASVHVYSDCYLTVSKEYTATGACVSSGDCKAAGWFPVPWREGAVGCLRWSRQHKSVHCCMDPHQLTKKAVNQAVESSESGEGSGHFNPSTMSNVRFAARRSKVTRRLTLQP